MPLNHPSGSIIKSSGTGIDLFQNQDLLVDPGIVIASASGDGVSGPGGNTITCNGVIGGDRALIVSASGSELVIGSSGTISGKATGVFLTGTENGSITNNGVIWGGIYGIVFAGSTAILNNGSIITGGKLDDNLAIYNSGEFGSVILNNGTIAAVSFGDTAIRGSNSSNSVDFIINNGKITGKVNLQAGDDIYLGLKGTVSTRADTIIDAGDGNDQLTGGAGIETMTGGTGRDTFFFKTRPDKNAIDHITDFKHSDGDKLALSKTFFKLDPGQSVAGAFQDITSGFDKQGAHKHILYDHDSGFLFYDKDGKGGAAPIHFATLDTDPSIGSSDILMV